jgi:hypothetical protein
MRSRTQADLWAAAITIVIMGACLVAYRMLGFAGIGLLGLFITFVAVRIDLEKEGAVGGVNTPGLLAQQMAARNHSSGAERAARDAEIATINGPLAAAKTVGVALTIAGFGALLFAP